MSKDFININLKDYEKNIKKLTIIQALRWTLFIMPVIIPFYQLYNLSMNQIFLIQTFYSFSLLLFEIPSGYFSDYLGRKKSLIIGTFFSFIGFLLYSFSYSFFGFVISEIILGIGSSFISGTDSAFIYENLKKLKKEKDYKKVEGKISFYCSFSEAISGFLAGFFALISLRFNFYIETIFVFIAFLISLTLYEDSSEIKKNKSKNKKELSLSKNLYNHYLEMKKSFNYAFNLKKEIKYVLFFSGFLATSTLIMTWLIQTYFQLLKIPIEFFGILWAIYNLSLGFFSLFSHNFEKFFGFKNSLLIFFLIIFFGYFSLSFVKSYFGLLILFLFYFVRAISMPIIKHFLNKKVKQENRATIISINGLFSRLFFSIISPFIGLIKDLTNLEKTFFFSSVIFLFLSGISYYFINKKL